MKKLTLVALVAATILLSGCAGFLFGLDNEQQRKGTSSSLVDYLYPDGQIPPPVSGDPPVLSLPMRVGLAFVPASTRGGWLTDYGLSATDKQRLLEQVSEQFSDRPYVAEIEVIPEIYMRSAKGVQGMQQLARMHGVDAMALVSYDQLALDSERESSILYWTIVGALVIKGNHTEVHTLIDTAVFDAHTSRLLFRAPGTNIARDNSTLVDKDRDSRRLATNGFYSANAAMIDNLDLQLEAFKAQVKRGERARAEWRDGHSGGGAAGLLTLFALAAAAARRYSAANNTRCSVSRRMPIASPTA